MKLNDRETEKYEIRVNVMLMLGRDDVITRSGDVMSRNKINFIVVSRRKVSEKAST